MRNKVVVLTGTPGTGKTHISEELAKKLNYRLIDLNDVIIKKKLYSSYDRKLKSFVVDVKKIKKLKFRENVLIDSHLSHFIKSDKVIVLRCKPNELVKRLKVRKYSKEKIRQNFESELIGLISWEARKYNKIVFDVDTTNKTKKAVIAQILKYLKAKSSNKSIDWCLNG